MLAIFSFSPSPVSLALFLRCHKNREENRTEARELNFRWVMLFSLSEFLLASPLRSHFSFDATRLRLFCFLLICRYTSAQPSHSWRPCKSVKYRIRRADHATNGKQFEEFSASIFELSTSRSFRLGLFSFFASSSSSCRPRISIRQWFVCQSMNKRSASSFFLHFARWNHSINRRRASGLSD